MFSIIYKKNWILFSSISYISPKRNSHCGCWSVTDRWYKDPHVEVPTITASAGMDAGGRTKGDENTNSGARYDMNRGESISPSSLVRSNLSYLSTFFYISHLVIGCCRSFYSFTIQSFERFYRFEFDCSRDFDWRWVPPTYDSTISSPSIFTLAQSLRFFRRYRRSILTVIAPYPHTMANRKWLT